MQTIGFLTLIGIQFCLFGGLIMVWRKTKKNEETSWNTSRQQQNLENQIAIIEDLSDRTEHQVKTMTALLENKVAHLQEQSRAAEEVIVKVQRSMKKSLEVASIFEDKIPHQEIIDRQNTMKYVKAAELAQKGHTVEQIVGTTGLGRAEVELIAKLNF